ncbi:MAG: hypothetical protein PHQ86_03305 [Dehalococcoidales bacterium]|nr:hypothetical protein [Dehalococcoidales bacterium]
MVEEEETGFSSGNITDGNIESGDSKLLDLEVKIIKNIEFSSYDINDKKEKLLLDLYLPEEGFPRSSPLIIYIHGCG